MSEITLNSKNVSRFNKRLQKALAEHFKQDISLHEAAKLFAKAIGKDSEYELKRTLDSSQVNPQNSLPDIVEKYLNKAVYWSETVHKEIAEEINKDISFIHRLTDEQKWKLSHVDYKLLDDSIQFMQIITNSISSKNSTAWHYIMCHSSHILASIENKDKEAFSIYINHFLDLNTIELDRNSINIFSYLNTDNKNKYLQKIPQEEIEQFVKLHSYDIGGYTNNRDQVEWREAIRHIEEFKNSTRTKKLKI